MGTRNERVVLSLEDAGFSSGMARAAAQAALLDHSLRNLDGANVDVDASSRSAAKGVDALGTSSRRVEPSIDRLSGRLGLAARAIGAFGPAAIPALTGTAAAAAGLAAQLAAVALGGAVVVSAFGGVGDALGALNTAKLEPTAENIAKAREQMELLEPAARRAVRAMSDLSLQWEGVTDAAQQSFFAGNVRDLRELSALMPQMERIFATVGAAAGDLMGDSAKSLASDEWAGFFDFLETDAAPTLTMFGKTLGNVAKGAAELMRSLDPLSDDFSGGMLTASESFEAWAEGVSQTEGYREFIDYVRETGPQVVETVGSLADAVLQIGEAAAPLGGPVLQGIELLADAIALIADSPLGTPIMAAVTAISLLSLTTKAFGPIAASSWMQAARGAQGYVAQIGAAQTAIRGLGRGALLLGGMTLATSDLGKSMDVTNTAMYASMGMMAGPWGAAAGATIGAFMDIKAESDGARDAIAAFNSALRSGDLARAQAELDALRESIADFETQDSKGLLLPGVFALPAVIDAGSDAWARLSGAYDETAQTIAGGDAELARAAEEAARAQGYATEETRKRITALDALRDALVAELNAELGWEQAMLDATKTVAENGRVVDEAGNALKGHEQASIDSRREVYGLIDAWNEQVRTGDATSAQMETTRAAIRRMAGQMGLGEAETRRLIRAMDSVKPVVKTRVEVATRQAIDSLGAFTRLYNSIQSKRVTLTTQYRSVSDSGSGNRDMDRLLLGPLPQALGGFYPARFYAGGGMDRANGHMPEIAQGGAWRVWAEPETGGETYIPHANDHRRPMAKQYLEQTATMFGGTVEWYANGGQRGGKDGDGIRELSKAAREAAKAMRAETKARLEHLKQERTELRNAVRDRFRSDIFAQPDNPWAAGGDWRSKLKTDIAQARSFNVARKRLTNKGVDGAALDDLLQNASLEQVQGMSRMSKKELAEYERLYNTRARVSARVGQAAGNAAYGKQIARLERTLRRIEAQLKDAPEKTGKAVSDGVNGAARNGSRRGGGRG